MCVFFNPINPAAASRGLHPNHGSPEHLCRHALRFLPRRRLSSAVFLVGILSCGARRDVGIGRGKAGGKRRRNGEVRQKKRERIEVTLGFLKDLVVGDEGEVTGT